MIALASHLTTICTIMISGHRRNMTKKIIAYLKYMKEKELIKIITIAYMGQELIEILELTGEAHIVLDND